MTECMNVCVYAECWETEKYRTEEIHSCSAFFLEAVIQEQLGTEDNPGSRDLSNQTKVLMLLDSQPGSGHLQF